VRLIRLLTLVGCLVAPLVAAGCDSSSPAPTAPTPAPAPTPPPAPAPTPPPAPTPTPPPAAPAALASLTLSSAEVPGQAQPIGTVTLTAAAPAGGAVVRLESTATSARVPASVTVAAGQTTATFTIDTSTVESRTSVTISAIYEGVTRTAPLTVLLPRPRAVFTVTSPTFGQDACALIENGLGLDCRLDGTRSEGRIVRWRWYLDAGERIFTDRPEGVFAEIDSSCRFVSGNITTGTDSTGKFVEVNVTLEVTDREGDGNSSSRKIKLYPNGQCGL
jgi:hypothetical protein